MTRPIAYVLAAAASFGAAGLAKPAAAELLIGLTASNELVRFDSGAPSSFGPLIGITGLMGGETLVGLDYRPATGQLYAIGSANSIYVVNDQTGTATLAGSLTASLAGTSFGVAFNPVPDRLRIASDAEQNLRVNVDSGAALVDGALAYAAGDANEGANPNIVGSAYINQFAGAATTALFGIDSELDVLVSQVPPNAGTLNTIGALGFDIDDVVGFDISGVSGDAFASFVVNGQLGIYGVNLSSGLASLLGEIDQLSLVGLAVAAPVSEPAALALLAVGFAGAGFFARRRTASTAS